MTINEALASYNAGTLASQSDAMLLAVQTNIDAAAKRINEWAAEVRESFKDEPDADVEAYLETTLKKGAEIKEVSDFITRTTTVRYGCAD